MRSLFPGYYKPTEQAFASLWQDATFIFDTSVLLNLYRYPEGARGELLSVLAQVRERIWIPHQVALEFQRNRPSVISEQKRRFQEVREICDRTIKSFDTDISKLKLGERHSLINPQSAQDELRSALNSFKEEIDALEKKHIDVHQDDELRDRIDDLIGDKIGPAPTQNDLDECYTEGALRYELSVPPGYEDAGKENGDGAVFMHAALRYERKYGDLIMWTQILAHARNSAIPAIVLITDDDKADWWKIIDSQGKKTLGPRPELVEEMSRRGGVQSFHMYKTGAFLQHAKTYLSAGISDAAIDQVESVAAARTESGASSYATSRNSVLEWLKHSRPFSIVEDTVFPDFSVKESDGRSHFVEVISPQVGSNSALRAITELENLRTYRTTPGDTFEVVVACKNDSQTLKLMREFSGLNVTDGNTVTIGSVRKDADQRSIFIPLAQHGSELK